MQEMQGASDSHESQKRGQRSIRASIIRGGTSKGVFVREEDLPESQAARDPLILELMGSPDHMQIDGMGGTHSHTSKLMAVSASERGDCDIDYLFAQVSVDRPMVDYGGNCGNLTAAIGPYAIEEGLVQTTEPVTTVRLYNKNTKKRVDAHVRVEDDHALVCGEHRIAGVPGAGALLELDFLEPAGSVFERLLPTGNVLDVVESFWGSLEVSFVDATNPLVFVRAADIGLQGDELPEQVNTDTELLGRIEQLRGACAQRLGLVEDPEQASLVTPGIPKLAFVAEPRDYETSMGLKIGSEEIDLLARIMSMQKLHHAYAMTGVMCTATASKVPGTIPHEVLRNSGQGVGTRDGRDGRVRLGHPKGIGEARVTITEDLTHPGSVYVEQVSVTRTARHLMTGEVFYRDPDEERQYGKV